MFTLGDFVEFNERKALYWWRPRQGVNMGDYLSKVIVNSMLASADLSLLSKRKKVERLFSIGSVMHFAKTGDIIWGTGVNGKIPREKLSFKELDVRSVRGPLTRNVLLGMGISTPEVYGDPGLLSSLFFPRKVLGDISSSEEMIIVPHMNESVEKYLGFEQCLLFPNIKPLAFIRKLLAARFVVSSSLHGIILAEAYGIPAVYLNDGNGEDIFKYQDYYEGTGRECWKSGASIAECREIGGNGDFDVENIQLNLLQAFPWDIWL